MNILRRQRKLVLQKKLREVAAIAGVGPDALSMIELEKRPIPYHRLKDFAKAYKLTIKQMEPLVDKQPRYAHR